MASTSAPPELVPPATVRAPIAGEHVVAEGPLGASVAVDESFELR